MTDRIYELVELAGIRMMPGFKSWMENAMHDTEEFAGRQENVLDLSLLHSVILTQIDPQDAERNDDCWWEPTIWEKIDAMQRLVDLRDGNIRSDVPELRDEHHPWCCPVWVSFRPKPPVEVEYGDIPF